MTRKQFERNNKITLILAVTLMVILTIHMIITTIRGHERAEQEKEVIRQQETQTERQREQKQEEMVATYPETEEAAVDRYAVFDTMSEDWGDEASGFTYFEIPDEYTDGYFPEKMQIFTYCVCRQKGVSYPLVVAIIERESGYVFDKIGDDGGSFGYMQVSEKWHKERMQKLGCDDLMNPYQNVIVGVDYLAELIEKYGTMQDALTAYNYGESGAYRHLWSKGIYVYDYNQGIMQRMREIREETCIQ